MKRFSEQFHTKAQKVTLKKSERSELRERLVSYMEYHPLPAHMRTPAATKRSQKTAARSLVQDTFSTYQIPFANLFKYGGALAAIMLLAVPFVAERAVPGDTLYAVKVNFNEEVRSTLTWDPYQKVEWETVRLNRRIAEAKLLEKEGRLTEEVEVATAAAVTQHAQNAKAEIETLRASDADEAAIAEIELDANLSLQAQAFSSRPVTATSTENNAATDLIADAIGQSLAKDPAAATTTLPALPKLIARVEQHTTRIHELRNALAGQTDTAALTDVTRRIEDVERVAAKAFALSQEDSIVAQQMLVDVLGRAQTLIVFMTELDVRETVAIETAVPVVLTEDEMTAKRASALAQIDVYLTQITAVSVEDEAVQEKVAAATEQIQTLTAELVEIDEYDTFMTRSQEVLTLARDTMVLLEQNPTGVESTLSTATTTEVAIASTTASSTDVLPEESDAATTTATSTDTTTQPEEVVEVAPATSTATSTPVVAAEAVATSTPSTSVTES